MPSITSSGFDPSSLIRPIRNPLARSLQSATPAQTTVRTEPQKAVNQGFMSRTKSGEALKSVVRTSEKLERLNNRLGELRGENIRSNSLALSKKVAQFFNFREQDSAKKFAGDISRSFGAYAGKRIIEAGSLISRIVSHASLGVADVAAGVTALTGHVTVGSAQLLTGVYTLGVGVAKLCSMASQKFGGEGSPRIDAHWNRLITVHESLLNAHGEIYQKTSDVIGLHTKFEDTLTQTSRSLEHRMGLKSAVDEPGSQSDDATLTINILKAPRYIQNANSNLAEQLSNNGISSDTLPPDIPADIVDPMARLGSDFAGSTGLVLESAGMVIDSSAAISSALRLERIAKYQSDPRGAVVESLNEKLADVSKQIDGMEKALPEINEDSPAFKRGQDTLKTLKTQQLTLSQEIALMSKASSSKDIQDAMSLMRKNQTQSKYHRALSVLKRAAVVSAHVTAAVVTGVAIAGVAATPVGWAIAGASLGITIGMGVYKAYKQQARVRDIANMTQASKEIKKDLDKISNTLIDLQDFSKIRQEILGIKKNGGSIERLRNLQEKARYLETKCNQALSEQTPFVTNLLKERNTLKQQVNALHQESNGSVTPEIEAKLKPIYERLADITDYIGQNPTLPMTTAQLDKALQFFGKKTRVTEDLLSESSSYLRQTSAIEAARILVNAISAKIPEPPNGPEALKVKAAGIEAAHVVSHVIQDINVDKLKQGSRSEIKNLQRALGLFYN